MSVQIFRKIHAPIFRTWLNTSTDGEQTNRQIDGQGETNIPPPPQNTQVFYQQSSNVHFWSQFLDHW